MEFITCPVCHGKKVVEKKLTEIEKAMGAYPFIPCEECLGTGIVTLTEERKKQFNLGEE
jgi:RecJ-like exonuclease